MCSNSSKMPARIGMETQRSSITTAMSSAYARIVAVGSSPSQLRTEEGIGASLPYPICHVESRMAATSNCHGACVVEVEGPQEAEGAVRDAQVLQNLADVGVPDSRKGCSEIKNIAAPCSWRKLVAIIALSMSTTFAKIDLPGRNPRCAGDTQDAKVGSRTGARNWPGFCCLCSLWTGGVCPLVQRIRPAVGLLPWPSWVVIPTTPD